MEAAMPTPYWVAILSLGCACSTSPPEPARESNVQWTPPPAPATTQRKPTTDAGDDPLLNALAFLDGCWRQFSEDWGFVFCWNRVGDAWIGKYRSGGPMGEHRVALFQITREGDHVQLSTQGWEPELTRVPAALFAKDRLVFGKRKSRVELKRDPSWKGLQFCPWAKCKFFYKLEPMQSRDAINR
jgi:hypothetical protein